MSAIYKLGHALIALSNRFPRAVHLAERKACKCRDQFCNCMDSWMHLVAHLATESVMPGAAETGFVNCSIATDRLKVRQVPTRGRLNRLSFYLGQNPGERLQVDAFDPAEIQYARGREIPDFAEAELNELMRRMPKLGRHKHDWLILCRNNSPVDPENKAITCSRLVRAIFHVAQRVDRGELRTPEEFDILREYPAR